MRILLDTSILIKLYIERQKIAPSIQDALANAEANYISKVSLWEISTKVAIGKLQIPKDFIERIEKSEFRILDISLEHIQQYQELPLHHRDPFDRMLIAQALTEKMYIATTDDDFKKYSAKLL